MAKKFWLGAHTSAAGGAPNALLQGQQIGATTIQLFTSNQKQWKGRHIPKEEISLWEKIRTETGMDHLMSHSSYLINLGSCNPELLHKSRDAFREELERCHQLQLSYLNFHPGSATKESEEACLETIIESLLSMEEAVCKGSTRLLLECTAGQGSSVGYRFEHLQAIIDQVHHKLPIGVCLDTCHAFAAGYDLRTEKACQETLDLFEEIVGLKHLYAFHLNDSQKELASRVDRHAPLGKGKIGEECFRFLMNHPKTRDLPKYLETPEGPECWKQEITLLLQYAKSS